MWTSTIEKFWRWLCDNISAIIMSIVVIAFLGLIVWGVISSDNNHKARCKTIMGQMHTAQDSLHLYTFDKECIESK